MSLPAAFAITPSDPRTTPRSTCASCPLLPVTVMRAFGGASPTPCSSASPMLSARIFAPRSRDSSSIIVASFAGSTASGVEVQPASRVRGGERERRCARRLERDLQTLGQIEIEARELAEAVAVDLAPEVLETLGGDVEQAGAARARQAIALAAVARADHEAAAGPRSRPCRPASA